MENAKTEAGLEGGDTEAGLEGVDTEVFTAYPDMLAVIKTTNKEDCIRCYDQWAKDGQYEMAVQDTGYDGPRFAAETLNKYFQDKKSGIKILDVACGTGFVGQQLQSISYSHIDALEPSKGMLACAATKGVYQTLICEGIGAGKTEINEDTYDVAVVAGGFSTGHHIPCIGMKELIRIVKPGGLIINVMREWCLSHVKEYVDRLEPFFDELEDISIWK